MLSAAIIETLESYVSAENVYKDRELSGYTSFKIGGPAELMIEPENSEQLSKVIKYLNLVECPFFVLGNGTNTLVKDAGYEGVVIHIGRKMNGVHVNGNRLTAQAGAALTTVARIAAENELTGLEFAAGIPGSVGGGVVMNAGAYDGDMSMVTVMVTVIDRDGNLMELTKESMEFGYRKSAIRSRDFVVVEVVFELKSGDREAIFEKMRDFNQRRRDKQPLEYPSAGSTFKRPEGYFAGQLIMDAGMRGFQIGGARIADKHCGFVINTGKASCEDVLDVIAEVSEKVKERFGVDLEPEIVVLG